MVTREVTHHLFAEMLKQASSPLHVTLRELMNNRQYTIELLRDLQLAAFQCRSSSSFSLRGGVDMLGNIFEVVVLVTDFDNTGELFADDFKRVAVTVFDNV